MAAAVVGAWGYYYITRDMPNLNRIDDYRPPAVSRVFSNDGTLIAEFYKERRYPAKLSEVPKLIRNCFLAAEDAHFYQHQGIDPMGILRAMLKNLQAGSVKQGGSTITQQVVKNLLLGDEKKIRRKVKEAILSYQIEKRLTKDEILELYLNQIFFGNSAYGIKAASRLYFHKELGDLDLAEGAILAGLPKAPSRYSPLISQIRAKRRQHYVLDQMVKSNFVTREEADAAMKEEPKIYKADENNIFAAPYYIEELRRYMGEHWKEINLDTDGVDIYTSLDLSADKFATRALRKGLREVDKRRGWRGPVANFSGISAKTSFEKAFSDKIKSKLESDTVYPALITDINRSQGSLRVDLGHFSGTLNLKNALWARRKIDPQDHVQGIKLEDYLKVGDVVEVVVGDTDAKDPGQKLPPGYVDNLLLDQTPDLEGALVLIDPHSGKVPCMVGGYSYQRSVFNRATQSLRQPGSTFKPIIYLTAVDGFKYTPGTIVHDEPRTFRVGDETWTPGNFDEKFLGAITLQTALERSRNLVSAEIVSNVGLDPVIQYARRLGITSKLGHNLSLSLGTSEVTPLELTRAYGVFPTGGVLFDTVLVDKIASREGKLIYDYDNEKLTHAKQVIPATSAFIMANMMKGVVERGTATRVKALNRPAAGKTGTSADFMDTWFLGYTPQWVAGVWVGFDQKKAVGNKETGGRVAAPIWLYFMQDFLNDQDAKNFTKLIEDTKADAEKLGIEYQEPAPLAPLDFTPPEGVEPFWMNLDSGQLSDSSDSRAVLEYFVKGTAPSTHSADGEDSGSYLDTPGL